MAWDPVRHGTLVRRAGDMIIFSQSVRILMNFENVTQIRNSLATIEEGVKSVNIDLKMQKKPNTRFWKRTIEIETRLTKL
ncbi:hypothetical protein E2C01_028689 [Portunus trituberculatus]|uniref:Uncharacterized protein n=1 Tax=Portunus trituberculatus TaxID=210409 RepID=A0A5B7EL45_PORTR|nr:hypothetical protein [Portunus trituberculatus]